MRTLHVLFGYWVVFLAASSVALFLGVGIGMISSRNMLDLSNSTDRVLLLLLVGLPIAAAVCQAIYRHLSEKVREADENIHKRWQVQSEARQEEIRKLIEERDAHEKGRVR